MARNLAIDDKLIVEAKTIGGKHTKKDVVTEALKEYIQRRNTCQSAFTSRGGSYPV